MNETSDGGNMTTPNMITRVEDALKMITGGIREIEIANIGFPQVLDTSIRVFAQSANESAVEKGDELIWQDMINCAEAELRASAFVSSATNESTINADLTNDDGVPVALTAQSGDELIDKVVVDALGVGVEIIGESGPSTAVESIGGESEGGCDSRRSGSA